MNEATPESQRKIIHCDCDCFYAAVEVRDNPALRRLPVAVGGSPRSRGVIATCNYEAREFGIHSAMPSSQAVKRCPDLHIVKPDFEKYRQVSRQIREIFLSYSDLIEPLSLDEAFLDVSLSTRCKGSATLIAQEIRERVRKEVGITISAGVAPNKFLAKIASDWKKPDGLFVITPNAVDNFVSELPVGKIFGVGKVTAAKLNRMGIYNCGELRDVPLPQLTKKFGIFGERLYQLSRGVDDRPVISSRRRKSLSVENTYAEDIQSPAEAREAIAALHKTLLERLSSLDRDYRINKLFCKVKFDDFTHCTMETSAEQPELETMTELVNQTWERKNRPVRLIGLGVRFRNLSPFQELEQLELELMRAEKQAPLGQQTDTY